MGWGTGWVAAFLVQGFPFPLEKSHGKGDERTGNCGGHATDVGYGAGDWDSGSDSQQC